MKKEDFYALAQLLNSMRDSVDKLEKAKKRNNYDDIDQAKKAILYFQKQINEIL